MPNTNMNFMSAQSGTQPATQTAMQPPGDQGQRRRMMLANMLQQGQQGGQQDNPYGAFSNAFNQQMMNHQMYGDQLGSTPTPTPQKDGNLAKLDQYYSSPNSRAGYTPDGGAQQAQSVMGRYGRPGGGSEAGYNLSSGGRPSGMMGSMGRMGNQLQSGASSLGKGAASLGSSAMKAMSAF